MSRKNRQSIQHQVKAALDGKLRIGSSRYMAKRGGTAADGIHSWGTYKAYLKHGYYFARWAKQAHGCRTLAEARPYAAEWLQERISAGLSPYTLKLESAALAKVYGCQSKDFCVALPPRHRADITRSRGPAARDAGFSEARNQEFADFCKGTGLRRSEISALRGDKLIDNGNGTYSIRVDSGSKGGRPRIAPVIGPHAAQIAARMRLAGKGKVWPSVPSHADIHGYRASYAALLYAQTARPIQDAKKERYFDRSRGRFVGGVYVCRRDRVGTVYDRRALLVVSRALGHSRVDVVPLHYLY